MWEKKKNAGYQQFLLFPQFYIHFTKQQTSRLVQIQSIHVCRWQNKCNLKEKFFLWWVENIAGEGENAGYQNFFNSTVFSKAFFFRVVKNQVCEVKNYKINLCFKPLPHMPIFGFSNSAANKDDVKIMSKIWINGNTIIWLSRKRFGKRRNCSLRAISPFLTMFSKAVCCWCLKMSIYGVKG